MPNLRGPAALLRRPSRPGASRLQRLHLTRQLSRQHHIYKTMPLEPPRFACELW